MTAGRSRLADPLAASYADARRLARRQARNFYWGMRLTPEPKRASMYAVYAWMRAADAIADGDGVEQAGEAGEDLQSFETQTRAIHDNPSAPPPDGFWPAFADTVRRFRLTLPPLLAMLQGQRDDLDHRPPAGLAEQRLYCERVASSVGHVCLELWGYDGGDATLAMAADRGVALQLTNILRDVAEDHAAGRCYLPLDRVAAAGVPFDGAGLPRLEPSAALAGLLEEQADLAATFYERSAGLEAELHPDGRRSSRAMAAVYRRLLDRIRAEPLRVLQTRVRLSTPRKLYAAWRG